MSTQKKNVNLTRGSSLRVCCIRMLSKGKHKLHKDFLISQSDFVLLSPKTLQSHSRSPDLCLYLLCLCICLSHVYLPPDFSPDLGWFLLSFNFFLCNKSIEIPTADRMPAAVLINEPSFLPLHVYQGSAALLLHEGVVVLPSRTHRSSVRRRAEAGAQEICPSNKISVQALRVKAQV